MRMRLPTVSDAYRLAWRGTRRLPAPLGYGMAHTVADVLWAWHRLRRATTGVGQLERNLSRILPPGTPPRALRRTTRAGMRSYMRYFYEAFALPGFTPDQVLARVRADLDPRLHDDLRAGSIVMALPHMGNWDLIGAWACRELATVLTVAERLKPDDLFEQFVAFREGLGMRIIGQAHGEKVFDRLLETARGGHYVVALLADRDLSSAGITARLGTATARVAAGPAAIAQRLDRPLYAVSIHYEPLSGERRRRARSPWGLVLTARKVPSPPNLAGREQVVAHTRDWVAELEPLIAEHPEDWHMLQPVFDADLDQERLARSHAREQQTDDRHREGL
ncbi:phosphatidylinositol mannoside acyltransferase [Actinomyces viscosus]|uniref:Phosphatidylinositol mannoside acyltransferase n=1 Tax=Actinomyces viscosus TaxID=1656 RepID=A0A3S4WIJ3_ACTVI|nr:phosphatidylinositol mannoside acyltransferase [Actinomyces viscosus]TFH52931.1 phosphatidylinositol mannoside acyltransferase [Actinomyces viscosus]VEI14790.1 Phosphatidylinositol mannoside acyltransferase [Actinomyces viscosus]